MDYIIKDLPGFIEEAMVVRHGFTAEMLLDDWWLNMPREKRVEIENILILYDQMLDHLKASQ